MSLKGFNLLQGNVKPQDAWDKLNDWITNIGRVIVMVVEIVVIVSFVARVIIDTQTKNLMEQEKSNTEALAAYKTKEIQFRDQQAQFQGYKQIWDNSSTYDKVIAELDRLRPQDINKLTISIQGDLINFTGESTVTAVGRFETNLKKSKSFSDVQVYEVERITGFGGQSDQASFGIRIIVKKDVILNRDKFSEAQST